RDGGSGRGGSRGSARAWEGPRATVRTVASICRLSSVAKKLTGADAAGGFRERPERSPGARHSGRSAADLAPREIDDVGPRHPAVAEAGTVGVPYQSWGRRWPRRSWGKAREGRGGPGRLIGAVVRSGAGGGGPDPHWRSSASSLSSSTQVAAAALD